jgi:hypothetical protein
MARNKQYNEQEVIGRCLYSGAMGIKIPRYVCWKEMGINQFSIYASFETWRFRRKLEML